MTRWFAVGVAIAAGACGDVAAMPDAKPVDANPVATYQGLVASVAPSPFGGTGGFCSYTITFQQLSISLVVQPDGQISSGEVHHHNFETIVGTCQFSPAMPTDSSYTLQAATPGTGTTDLTFTGAATNSPKADLAIKLMPGPSSTYKAMLTAHRTDLGPPLDWTVSTTVTLTVKPQ